MSELGKGKLLLAEPFMGESIFKRSAVLITDHSPDDGAIGYVLNKTITPQINDLIEDFPEIESRVYSGGPVSQETLHYIHDVGEILDGSIKIMDGVYWGGDFVKLKFLISSKLILPRNIRFFLGYSGWSPGQLEDEITFGSWVVDDMDSNYLFSTPHRELWKRALKNKGNHFSVIAEIPDNHVLN